MSPPCIISVAITGSMPRKKDNPAVPISTTEQVESTQAAYEAGAALVHVHVRDEQENPSSDVGRFARLQEGLRQHCPGIIIQFSTGGRGRSLEERGAMLHLKPDMASLATGSVNFPTIVYQNPPDFIRTLAQTMLEDLLVRSFRHARRSVRHTVDDQLRASCLTPKPTRRRSVSVAADGTHE